MSLIIFVIVLLAKILLSSAAFTQELSAQQLLTQDHEKIDFARNLLAKSQYKLAASQFEEFIKQFPQSSKVSNAYIGAGDSYFFIKSYDQAISFYKKYTELFAGGQDIWLAYLRWGQALYILGNKNESLEKLKIIDPAVVQAPFLQTYYFFLAQAYSSQHQVTDAKINFAKATEGQVKGDYVSESYLLWGNLLSQEANYINAMDKYTKAFEVADNDQVRAEIVMKEGQVQFLLGRYDVSAKMFKNIIDDFPSTSVIQEATINWFMALLKNKQFNLLMANYTQKFKDNFKEKQWVPVHFAVIDALIIQGKNEEALAILNNLILMTDIEESQRNKAVLEKAQILISSGKLADAVSFLDAQSSPDISLRNSLWLLKAQSQIELKDYENAWNTYSVLIHESPESSEAICGMAHVRFGQDKYDEAALLFMSCFQKSKEEEIRQDALYNSFLMYKKTSNVSKAMEVVQIFIQEFHQSKHFSNVIFDMAGLSTLDHKYVEAIELLKRIVNPSNQVFRQHAIFQIAYNYQLGGDANQALSFYNQIIDEPMGLELKFFGFKNMAIIYLQKNDQDKAAGALDWIVRKFPPNDLPLDNYLWLAEYWQLKNEPQKMLDVLAEAQKRPAGLAQSKGVLFFIAEANRLKNNCSIHAYDEIMSGRETNPYKGRARLGKGLCFSASGDPAAAKKELEGLITDNPDDNFITLRARYELARIFESLKDFDQAIKLYMLVALLYKDPTYSPQALIQAGQVFQGLENNQEALNVYNQILEDYPQSPFVIKAKEFIGNMK